MWPARYSNPINQAQHFQPLQHCLHLFAIAPGMAIFGSEQIVNLHNSEISENPQILIRLLFEMFIDLFETEQGRFPNTEEVAEWNRGKGLLNIYSPFIWCSDINTVMTDALIRRELENSHKRDKGDR